MKKSRIWSLWSAAVSGAILSMAFSISAGAQVVDSVHFLIPGGAGGGWDGTARGRGNFDCSAKSSGETR